DAQLRFVGVAVVQHELCERVGRGVSLLAVEAMPQVVAVPRRVPLAVKGAQNGVGGVHLLARHAVDLAGPSFLLAALQRVGELRPQLVLVDAQSQGYLVLNVPAFGHPLHQLSRAFAAGGGPVTAVLLGAAWRQKYITSQKMRGWARSRLRLPMEKFNRIPPAL